MIKLSDFNPYEHIVSSKKSLDILYGDDSACTPPNDIELVSVPLQPTRDMIAAAQSIGINPIKAQKIWIDMIYASLK